MTILAKGIGEKKPAVPEDTKAILKDAELGGAAGAASQQAGQDDLWYMTPRERTVSTLCLFLVALLITAFGVAVGIHIYQQCAQQSLPMQFSGMFSIPYDSSSPQDYFQSSMMMSDDDSDDIIDRLAGDSRFFHEKLETDSEDRMRIYVPSFKDGRKGRFVHDFSVNKTVIVDQAENTCFVMPLDTSRIVRPKNMIELVKKIWDGTYNVNTTVIRETMTAAPFPEDEKLSPYLADQCEGKILFKLYKTSGLVKRSVNDGTKHEAFYSYTGKQLTMIDIMMPENSS